VIVGVPRETKIGEQRVALTPAGAHALIGAGHGVLIEPGAGTGSGISDDEYVAAGADLTPVDGLWAGADLILKVKEPQPGEVARLHHGHTIFTYLHLAPAPELTRGLQARGCIAIAYETVEREDGSLPLLTPMSEVAGRLSTQEGVYYLGRARGGRGILLSGVPGVPHGNVAILGAGTAGVNAAKAAVGLGADVSILDIDLERLRAVDDLFGGRVVTIASNSLTVARVVQRADLLIGAVLVPGARAPVVVTEDMVKSVKPGAVIVDIAVDQGGCVATTRPTSLVDPVYTVHGVVHYAVTNMPALVPRTSTFALANATLPYVLDLTAHGPRLAVTRNRELGRGVNVWRGRIVHPAVAASLNEPAVSLDEAVRDSDVRS
jgi:alanine dehydrogenase